MSFIFDISKRQGLRFGKIRRIMIIEEGTNYLNHLASGYAS